MGSALATSICPFAGDEEASEDSPLFTPFRGTGGKIRVLILGLDYKYVKDYELTCTKDAQSMLKMCKRAGIADQDIEVISDHHAFTSKQFPVRQMVLNHIKKTADKCADGDWFIWFYAGHGVNVKDHNADEDDGQDEAFVTPDRRGELAAKAVLVDDDFARALDTYVPEGVKILCINDCCHSGTICDIESYKYRHEIYAIAASQDNQEAEETGGGGVLSAALRRTIRELSIRHGEKEFSIQTVYNGCLKRAEKLTSEQNLNFQFYGTHPKHVAWPLCFGWKEYLHGASGDVNAYESDGDDDLPLPD